MQFKLKLLVESKLIVLKNFPYKRQLSGPIDSSNVTRTLLTALLTSLDV